MKAIILSAGQGSRPEHLVNDRPKRLSGFNGRSLLDRRLDTLNVNEVKGDLDSPFDVDVARKVTSRWDAAARVAAA